jgi:hypothetical protein
VNELWEAMYGSGPGYWDEGDAGTYGVPGGESSHTHFLVWLIVFTLAAVSILGGLKVGGFHFVVKV